VSARTAWFLLALPMSVGAQDVSVREPGPAATAGIIQRLLSAPHTVRAGSERLVLTRDSTLSTGLLVLGRSTYLAGRVEGDVVVVGADLFLRPGADVRGRAAAVGGTVATTMLGQVGQGTLSLRDETYDVTREGDAYVLRYRNLRPESGEPAFALAGFHGLVVPRYDRVDGLSLPVGAVVSTPTGFAQLQADATYRSRLGIVDPGGTLTITPSPHLRFVARGARDTRTNDDWIYSDFVNSLTSFFAGVDARNYFRSSGGSARLIATVDRGNLRLEPYVGVRLERVSSISATGNVWSFLKREDTLGMRRPNPAVEFGDLQTGLAGIDWKVESEGFSGRGYVRGEQSFATPDGTTRFFQLTLDGTAEFPTFHTQSLRVKAHGVVSSGDAVPRSRYAYLGGSGTLATLDLLEQGGTELLYVENRYLIPIEAIQIPFVGAPVLSVRDAFGAAGVGSLPSLQHEIGAGIGISALHLDVNTAVAGRKRTKFGASISLSM
jgi:hypothetical protein